LTAELDKRYKQEVELEARGNEADVFFVTDRQTNEKRVIKFYRKGINPKTEIMELMKSLDSSFVVRQYSYGISEGRTYEVMEQADGSLAELISKRKFSQSDLPTVIGQLTQAVSYLHGLTPQIVHRDLKPDNILVRNKDPLKLILADFSFASSIEGGSRVATTLHRTLRYAAPEAAYGDISPAADWWSVGMIIAELAASCHPFAGYDEKTVLIHLGGKKLIPLDNISDPRVKLLCQGLLIYDQPVRWGKNEIERWLAGDTSLKAPVDVVPRQDGSNTDELRASRPYLIGSKECWTARELAAALSANWDLACKDVGRFQMLYDWLKDQLGNQNAARALHDLSDGPNIQQMDITVKDTLRGRQTIA
jgi:serine/threonine protein kinase